MRKFKEGMKEGKREKKKMMKTYHDRGKRVI